MKLLMTFIALGLARSAFTHETDDHDYDHSGHAHPHTHSSSVAASSACGIESGMIDCASASHTHTMPEQSIKVAETTQAPKAGKPCHSMTVTVTVTEGADQTAKDMEASTSSKTWATKSSGILDPPAGLGLPKSDNGTMVTSTVASATVRAATGKPTAPTSVAGSAIANGAGVNMKPGVGFGFFVSVFAAFFM